MNREIKFRGWDSAHKTMVNPYCELVDGRFWGEDTTNTGISVGHEDVMQYTGLKDKNGVDIYEGDIVNAIEEGIDENFMPSGEIWSQRNAEVYWDGLIAGWALRAESFERGCEPMTHLDSFEVIGNIYETPELLNNVLNVQGSDARDVK